MCVRRLQVSVRKCEINRMLVDQKVKGAIGHFRVHQVVAKQLNFSRGPYDACYLLMIVGYHRVLSSSKFFAMG